MRDKDIRNQDQVHVSITEPWVVGAIQQHFASFDLDALVEKFYNASDDTCGDVFATFVALRLVKWLDRSFTAYEPTVVFGNTLQNLTGLTYIKLRDPTQSSRIVCTPNLIPGGSICVTQFLKSSPAHVLWLEKEMLAGPDLVCVLTAEDSVTG